MPGGAPVHRGGDGGELSRYLLTGAAGVIGSHLAETLLARGHEVVGVDCFTPYYARAVEEANVAGMRDDPSFTLHEVDLVEADVAALLDGVEGIFHLAAQTGVRASRGADFSTYVHHNILATQRVFEAAIVRNLRVGSPRPPRSTETPPATRRVRTTARPRSRPTA